MPALSTIGGTTLSAGIADSQAQLSQAMGAGAGYGTDSLAQFAAAYRASGGGPTLAFLGFNPFQVVATGAFHALFWSVVVIFLGIMTLVALQQALRGRYALSARNPMVVISQVYFRLMMGVLIISNTPLVYGVLMTLNGVLSQGVQAMAAQAAGGLFQAGSMGTLTFAQARIEAVRNAAARRAVALYPAGASRAEAVQLGTWYNAMAGAVNAALAARNQPGQLPVLQSAAWTGTLVPDDQVTSYVGRNVIQNFGPLVADLGALPASSGPLSVPFPSGGSTSLSLLSSALAADDAQAAQAMALPNTPSSNASFESARQLYARSVLADTLGYLDTQVLPVISASPTLSQRAQAWFSEKVEQAGAAAGGFMTQWRAAVDWLGRGIGVVLTRMVAFFFTAATEALLEIELFMLVLAMPLWLLPATEGAFHGVLRSLVSLSVAVPAYQFIMLFVDALMGLVLKYVMFGPLAAGGAGAAPSAGGVATLVAAALAAVGGGGEIVALVIFCYMVAYVFLAITVALKTPRLIALFLKGAGAAGAFLSTFATGLIAGAATALATAAVAGGGASLAGSLLGGGSHRGGTAPGGARPGPPGGFGTFTRPLASRPRFAAEKTRDRQRPPAGKAPQAPRPQPSFPAASLAETAGFGFRTFTDCLGADGPADGVKIALRSLEIHRRQQEKEAEARQKARLGTTRSAARGRG
jgi:hypothetical protein